MTNEIDKMLIAKYSDKQTVLPENYKDIDLKYEPSQNSDIPDTPYTQKQYKKYFAKTLEKFDNMNSCLKELKHNYKKNKDKIEEIRQEMQDFVNPNKMYERLGVDILNITVSNNLLPLADPEVNVKLLAYIAALRQKLTDDYGYIIPNIRVMDSSILEDNTYTLAVRGYVVFTGNISDDEIINNDVDSIISNMEKIFLDYAPQIMTKTDSLKLMELVRSQDPTLVNDLVPTFLSAIDLKKIFSKLIQDRYSIKDIILVFEILNDYARYTQDTNELVKILKNELHFAPFFKE